jgi:hypothetical protein
VSGKRECSNSKPAPAKEVTVFDRLFRGRESSGKDSESSRARRDSVGERSDWGVRGGEGEFWSGRYGAGIPIDILSEFMDYLILLEA